MVASYDHMPLAALRDRLGVTVRTLFRGRSVDRSLGSPAHSADGRRPGLALLGRKHYGEPSAFTPEALLRQARRQRGLPEGPVPSVCLLDPDGDIVRYLRRGGRGRRLASWACYHTELDVFDLDGREVGVVGGAVGASFAVLVAEELFASGCELLVSVTSAGRVAADGDVGFVLIERALRDEGTSYHYLPVGEEAELGSALLAALAGAFEDLPLPVVGGDTWTTDAPFRETRAALEQCAADGILCVEMEAAALYAFALARARRVVCVAHLTNELGRVDVDFEKGAHDGAEDALAVVARVAARLGPRPTP